MENYAQNIYLILKFGADSGRISPFSGDNASIYRLSPYPTAVLVANGVHEYAPISLRDRFATLPDLFGDLKKIPYSEGYS